MVKNSVILDIKDYNNLRDFKKGIEEGKLVTIDYYSGEIYSKTESEIVSNLMIEMKEDNSNYRKLIDIHYNEYKDEIKSIKNLSLWGFIRYKYIK